jgi:hypothetical protein
MNQMIVSLLNTLGLKSDPQTVVAFSNTVKAVSGPVAIRYAYDGTIFTFWVGYGSDTDTDQNDIEIKRGVTNPVTGLVTETTATGPWDNYLTLPYS